MNAREIGHEVISSPRETCCGTYEYPQREGGYVSIELQYERKRDTSCTKDSFTREERLRT